MELINPWAVETLDTYLYYCCPQCDLRCKNKTVFVEHAYETHPESKNVISDPEVACQVQIKIEPEDEFENEQFLNELQTFEDFENGKIEFEEKVEKFESESEDEYLPPGVKKRKLDKERQERLEKREFEKSISEFQCFKCGDIFKSMIKVKKHLKENHKIIPKMTCNYGVPREFQCSECQRMFENEENLKNHPCNEEEGHFQCYRCGKMFEKESKVRFHLKNDHRISRSRTYYGPKRNFQCHVCNRMCETEEHLNDHDCARALVELPKVKGKNNMIFLLKEY